MLKGIVINKAYYNHQAHRYFLITLYNVIMSRVRVTIVAMEKQ